jgi:hypothetical protein
MKSIVEYSKNIMGKVNDTLNNKKKAEESQHYIMNIYNIDNDDHLHFECKAFTRIACLYFFITVDLEELPDFKMVEKQEYELRLNSKQIERIFLKSLEELPDFKKAHEKQEMEDLLLKDALKLMLNFFEKLSDDVE